MKRETLHATLRVPQGVDRSTVARYFRRDALPEGDAVELRELLPPFAHAREGRFAPLAARHPPTNCFWSALHFFDGPEPAGAPLEGDEMLQRLRRDYVAIAPSDRTFGDVLALLTASGNLLHTANFIAEDVIFTKNGGSRVRPWQLGRLSELALAYPEATATRWFRRRVDARL